MPTARRVANAFLADVVASNPFYAYINRITQQDLVSGYQCGGLTEPCDDQGRPYYRPVADVTRQQMAKFIDNARRLSSIDIEVDAGSPPIIARTQPRPSLVLTATAGKH